MASTKDLKERYFRLEKSLGYKYRELGFLENALTHRSAGLIHNERVEFLGDSILGFVIADKLFEQFPNVQEGDLTRMRSTLVKESTLAEIAREFKLSDYLIMGPGELKSGGYRRDSVLADAVESIIASIYLDCGRNIEVIRALILTWFEGRLKVIHPGNDQKDPKTQLQEFLQARHQPLPIYTVTEISGEDHDQSFTVRLTFENNPNEAYIGYGTSRRKAEQNAASKALQVIYSKNTKR